MEAFYQIDNKEEKEDMTLVSVTVNKEHDIYKAHFPNHPITPGAMLVGVATEIVAAQLGLDTDIKELKNVKFLVPHHPQEHEHLTFAFKAGQNPVEVTVCDGEVVFAKMTLAF